MAQPPPNYIRLPGHGIRYSGQLGISGTRSSLWLAQDHLLCLELVGFEETYKRFYFRDIQAIILQKTNLWLTWNVVWVLLLLIFGLLAWQSDDPAGLIILGSLAAFCLIGLVGNLSYGPSCRCYLRTAVQTELLPAWHRLRTARKGLARIMPLIEAVQGTLPAEEVQSRIQSAFMQHPGEVTDVPLVPTPSPIDPLAPAPLVHCHGRFHEFLFYFLIFDACLATANLAHSFAIHEALNALVTLGELICLIGAFVTQRHSDMSDRTRFVLFCVACTYGGLFVAGIVYGTILGVSHQGVYEVRMSPWSDNGLLTLTIASILCALPMGVWGLLTLRQFRREAPAGEVAPGEEK